MFVVSYPGEQYEKVKLANEGGGLMKRVAVLGRTKCVDLIVKRYCWPGITANMAKYLVSCHRCQIKTVKVQKANNVLFPIPLLQNEVFQIGKDNLGPFASMFTTME